MERLSGLDAAFLYLETPNIHMQVSMVAILEGSTIDGGYSFARVKELIRSRLPNLAPFRRRLVQVPFRLHHPVWVDSPDFDLDYHVRRVALPSPGGHRELAELVGDINSRQLDRNRPLWEIWVVEGLAHGRYAIIPKMHHCTVDGVSGAEIMVHLFDLEPSPPVVSRRIAETPAANEAIPSDSQLVTEAAIALAKQPRKLFGTARRTFSAVRDMVERRRDPGAVGMPAPFTAPRTTFNAAITPHRACAWTSLPLADVKKVKNAFGTTVNDVVLSICSGALRRYLARIGDLPERSLIAVVPISVRGEGDVPGGGSNKVSALFTTLATNLEDPVERLRAIAAVTSGAKEDHKAIGADKLQSWAEFAAPTVFALASRVYSNMKLADHHRPIHNLIISNVPGPQFPIYFAGAEVVGAFPMGPVMEGAGLNISVMSYKGALDFGLHACRELMPQLASLEGDLHAALAELVAAIPAG